MTPPWAPALAAAQALAAQGRAADVLAAGRALLRDWQSSPDALLDLASVLAAYGFVSPARECCLRVRTLAPHDARPLVNLANLAREAGEHREARRIYDTLLEQLPDSPVIRRNALVGLEYDPEATDEERLARARAWGEWATARAGGVRQRPPANRLTGRPLRVGYVSADFCQHTVGLFVKDVLASHDASRVRAFAYSAGRMRDWVTEEVARSCTLRDVAALDDASLAALVRDDAVDVLIDLSGHTGGSRLTAFAYRPAPLQLSWLGYFASTGLSAVDAVLLDRWHAPPGTEAQFVERVVRLPRGRLCYAPVPWAPEPAPAPSVTRGHVTFGCFNNTSKLNADVFALWAKLLRAAPSARLLLKWRTLGDPGLRHAVHAAFAEHGIPPERVELRGASFHADLLGEYGEVDVALDPFPFTGGMTSCEALWMGVPVVTWPQGRVVSRQTGAVLSAIGLQEWATDGPDDYVRVALALAADTATRSAMRRGLREHMARSSLCDVRGFTRGLEDTLANLFSQLTAAPEH